MTKPQPKKVPEIEVVTPELGKDLIVEVKANVDEVDLAHIEIEVLRDEDLDSITSISTYTTAFYQDNGIPTCNVCGEKYRTDRHGLPLCPVDAVDCPRK